MKLVPKSGAQLDEDQQRALVPQHIIIDKEYGIIISGHFVGGANLGSVCPE